MKNLLRQGIYTIAGLGLCLSARAELLELEGASQGVIYQRLDHNTFDDLMWIQDVGSISGSNKGYLEWDEANFFAENLVYGGYDDWRLPSCILFYDYETGSCGISELNSLAIQEGVDSNSLDPFATPLAEVMPYWLSDEAAPVWNNGIGINGHVGGGEDRGYEWKDTHAVSFLELDETFSPKFFDYFGANFMLVRTAEETLPVSYNDLIIDSVASTQDQYTMNNGDVSAITEIIGLSGNGLFTQNGGNNTVSETLTLGQEFGSKGIYKLKSDLLSAKNEIIGDEGKGTFTQSGGTHTVNETLTLGKSTGGEGNYNLESGELTVENEIIGDEGTGSFSQTGGTHTINQTLTLGQSTGGKGSYALIDGELTANNEIIGGEGIGSFTQTGGTHTVNQALTLGESTGSEGKYELQSGLLEAGYIIVGHDGEGLMTQTGGNIEVAKNISIGDRLGSGQYDISDGTLVADQMYVGNQGEGVVNQTGGSVLLTGENSSSGRLSIAKRSGSTGTYNLTGGTLEVDSMDAGNGQSTLNIDGGTLTVNSGDIKVDRFQVGNAQGSAGQHLFNNGDTLTATDVVIGNKGAGFIAMLHGDNSVSSINTIIGKEAESTGVVMIRGSTTTWNNDENFIVGDKGEGALLLLNSSSLTSANGSIAAQSGSKGTVTVRGNAGWAIDSNLYVGGSQNGEGGTGKLTVESDGSVIVGEQINIYQQGTVDIKGGSLSADSINIEGTLNYASGTLAIANELILAGNGLLDVAENSSLVLNSSVIHNGAAINVNDNSKLTFAGAVTGGGDYTGNGTIAFENEVRLGNSPDLINIEGDMLLGENSQTFMEIEGKEIGTGYDAFNIGGSLWLDGLLNISFSDDFFTNHYFDNNFSFNLFSAENIFGEFDLGDISINNLISKLDWTIDYVFDDNGTDYVYLNLANSLQIGGGGIGQPGSTPNNPTTDVPEPSSILLMMMGSLGLLYRRKKSSALLSKKADDLLIH